MADETKKLDMEQLEHLAPLRRDCAEELARRKAQTFDILTATHLPNGAQILSRQFSHDSAWVVLCSWEKGSGMEYITWVVDPHSGAACRGSYYRFHEQAERDFCRRIGETPSARESKERTGRVIYHTDKRTIVNG